MRYPSPHQGELLVGLREAVLNGWGCDITLELDDGVVVMFPRWILMLFSPYFRAMFESSMKERDARNIPLHELESLPFVLILSSLVGAELVITESNFASILRVSDRFDFP